MCYLVSPGVRLTLIVCIYALLYVALDKYRRCHNAGDMIRPFVTEVHNLEKRRYTTGKPEQGERSGAMKGRSYHTTPHTR